MLCPVCLAQCRLTGLVQTHPHTVSQEGKLPASRSPGVLRPQSLDGLNAQSRQVGISKLNSQCFLHTETSLAGRVGWSPPHLVSVKCVYFHHFGLGDVKKPASITHRIRGPCYSQLLVLFLCPIPPQSQGASCRVVH